MGFNNILLQGMIIEAYRFYRKKFAHYPTGNAFILIQKSSGGRSTQILYVTLKVPVQQCKNTPFHIKVLHSKSYISREVLSGK